MQLELDSSASNEDPASQLQQEVDFLQSENQLLRRFLQRVAPELLAGQQAIPALDTAPQQQEGGGLLIGEKNEICTQEVEACAREVEICTASGVAHQAHLAAAVAECKLQVAETRRDAHDLLKLLGLELGCGATQCSVSPQPEQQAPKPPAAGEGSSGGGPTPGGAARNPRAEPGLAQPGSGNSESSSKGGSGIGVLGLDLPSALQLAQATVPGERVEKFLEGLLRRHDLAVERLHMRSSMLKVQLAKLEASVAIKVEMGGALQQVDYEQLKIQHAQAQQKLEKHNAECVVLKSDMGLAMQVLADLRNSLASTAGESAALQRQILATQKQLGMLRAGVAGVQGECNALAGECEELRREKGAGEGEGALIMDYIKVKNAVQEAQKKIEDYRRKIEVASLKNSRRPG